MIDLVTGDPPITSESGTIAAVLNGEIYNYRALRKQLAVRGHSFSTRCDTEVLAHLAETLDAPDLAAALDGMFAFAVWDEERERLLLGRDRFGKKPLYWSLKNGRLVFGSEIKAVLSDPWISRELEPTAMASYLAFGYVPEPRTFYSGIMSLPPGHVLTFEVAGDHEPRIERFWSLPIRGIGSYTASNMTFGEAASAVRQELARSVARRMVADVPLGAFLSGGIDSAAVVACMAEQSNRTVRTFTIGFEDSQGFDERPYAAAVARRFRTDHVDFVVRPQAAELIEQLVFHYDQPFGDSSALPTYLLSQMTRQHVTVALCGDGGDEIFAGYERFAAAKLLDLLSHAPGDAQLLKRIAGRVPFRGARSRTESVRRLLAATGLRFPDAYHSWVAYIDAEWRQRLLPESSADPLASYRALWRQTEGAALLDRLLALNLETYLVGDLLPKVDRMSMAHGLEVRSPFLDQHFAMFASQLPPAFKARGPQLKRVLKRGFADVLPRSVIHRRKRGFGVPLDRWFRTDLRDYARGMLSSRRSRVAYHLEPQAITTLLMEHDSEHGNHGHAIWSLLTLEIFLRNAGW